MANSHGFDLQITPDILILPSQLNPFAKRAGDVLCINPGRLTKGATAGTFARATIHPIIHNICSRSTRTKACDLQDAITADEKFSGSPSQETAVQSSDHTPHQLDADFNAVIGADTAKEPSKPLELEPSKPLELESSMVTDTDVDNEQSRKAEFVPATIGDLPTTSKSIHPDPNEGESFEAHQSDNRSEPILHRVLERTRVDIIRL
jgi:hypothetical protein